MLVPSIFNDNLFDNFFDFPPYPDVDHKLYGHRAGHVMKTDIKEKDASYEIAVDLPGFKKDEVKVALKDGYLNISTQKTVEEGDKNEEGKYIRRERYYGGMSRSFYVGKEIEQGDIKAKFEDGVLKLEVPKVEAKKKVETEQYIAIE